MTDNFQLITLEGDNLKGVSWTPGQKIEVFLDSHIPSTYNPISWDSFNGVTRLVVYSSGAASAGAMQVNIAKPGEIWNIWGPRQSLDLTELRSPVLFFGDETSIGLAHALRATRNGLREVAFLFEASSPMESKIVLQKLGIDGATVLKRREIEAAMHRLIEELAPEQFVLTGNAPSTRSLTKLLRGRHIPASKVMIMEYRVNRASRFD